MECGMNSNEKEIAAVSASGAKDGELRDMFPVVRFIVQHPLELLALAISLVGIIGFAAGASFYEGWNKAAGISSNLFPVGPYETILLGMMLSKPWLISGVALTFILVCVQLTELFSEWGHARWGRENFLQRRRRFSIVKSARRERLLSSLDSRSGGSANKAWAILEFRNRWGKVVRPLAPKEIRQRRVILRIAGFVLAVSALALIWISGFWVKTFIIDTARAQGAERFVGLHIAVTGRLPTQIESKLGPERMQELACLGEESRWQYRSVDLLGDGKRQAYIIQSTDKLFLLLDKDGSTLHSFGDAAFSLRESAVRPVSKLAQNCSKSAAQK